MVHCIISDSRFRFKTHYSTLNHDIVYEIIKTTAVLHVFAQEDFFSASMCTMSVQGRNVQCICLDIATHRQFYLQVNTADTIVGIKKSHGMVKLYLEIMLP